MAVENVSCSHRAPRLLDVAEAMVSKKNGGGIDVSTTNSDEIISLQFSSPDINAGVFGDTANAVAKLFENISDIAVTNPTDSVECRFKKMRPRC